MTPAALDSIERRARGSGSVYAKTVLLLAAELRRAWRETEVQRVRGNLLKACAEIYKARLDNTETKTTRRRGMNLKRWWLALVMLCASLGIPAAGTYGPYTLIAPVAIDGDTLRAEIVIWPRLSVDASIRLLGVNTAEMKTENTCKKIALPAARDACFCERAAAIAARDFADQWIVANQPMIASQIKPDEYSGRYDAVVTGKDGSSLAAALIAAGHGRVYTGGARAAWCP